MAVQGSNLWVTASHQLPMGRWLNVTILSYGPSKGFPMTRLKVGEWTLPPLLSRWVFELGRWYVIRRVDVPPLDQMVRDFAVKDGQVSAVLRLPGKMGIVDQMAGAMKRRAFYPTRLESERVKLRPEHVTDLADSVAALWGQAGSA